MDNSLSFNRQRDKFSCAYDKCCEILSDHSELASSLARGARNELCYLYLGLVRLSVEDSDFGFENYRTSFLELLGPLNKRVVSCNA